MKSYLFVVFFSLFIACCTALNKDYGDFRTASERTEDELKGSGFLGKDSLTWNLDSESNHNNPSLTHDTLWDAASKVMSEYPISFNNFHARIIQTDWVMPMNHSTVRYRYTVRLLGKTLDRKNINVSIRMEKKQENSWISATPDVKLHGELIDKIIIKAKQLYNQNQQN